MKQRQNVQLAIAVISALKADPGRSNQDIAREVGTAEACVRRHRCILETCGLLPSALSRRGTDGTDYALPRRAASSVAIF